jgi:hypothetical protein
LIGPGAAGFAFDMTRSYSAPILASVCANIIAAGIMAGLSNSPGPPNGAMGRA